MSLNISYTGVEPFHLPSDSWSFNMSKNRFFRSVEDPYIGFYRIVDQDDYLNECTSVYEKFSHKKHFCHIGIGGSSLGPEMLVSALGTNSSREFVFINNIDPDKIYNQLKNIPLKDTLFYFVSKSGGTAETMAGLAIITSLLKQNGIQSNELKDHFVFATDPVKSELLEIGKELGVYCLPIPSNVGGRFSVLTPVGLLPALFANINGKELLKGARCAKMQNLENVFKVATSVYELLEGGYRQTVLMPYSSLLRDFSFWFTQLWAESLGKKWDASESAEIYAGLTPIPAYGATDQHSQVQLFMEGPHDKLVFIVEIEKFKQEFQLNCDLESPALKKLSKYSLSQLMKAEMEGTMQALSEAGRPYIHISMDKLDEFNLGELILFFESLTVAVGDLLAINPFNQPGVEAGKKYAFEYLEKL